MLLLRTKHTNIFIHSFACHWKVRDRFALDTYLLNIPSFNKHLHTGYRKSTNIVRNIRLSQFTSRFIFSGLYNYIEAPPNYIDVRAPIYWRATSI